MDQKATRPYKISDDDLRTLADKRLTLFRIYQEGFKAFNSHLFGDAFATELEKKLERVSDIKNDTRYRLAQRSATRLMTEKRAECYEQLTLAFYYVKVAGRKDREFLKQFQLGRVTKARTNTGEMLLFLDDVIHDLTTNRGRLVKVGFPRELIDTLRTLRRELADLRQKQEDAIEERRLATMDRVAALNAIWEDMVELAEVVPFAFPEDYLAQKEFKLPPQKRKGAVSLF